MTFSKVSVLVPTRNRLPRLATLLESYALTTFGAEDASELVFRVDDDDTASQEALRGHRMTVGPRCRGYASIPQFFNEALLRASGDVVMCGNDDMIFRTPRWAEVLLETARPDGLFDLGVSTHNAGNYPFATVSKWAIDVLGYVGAPEIFWVDIFWRDVMAAFGRCIPVPQVYIEHDWAGFAPDQVFLEANQNDIYRRDPHYWASTHNPAVNAAIEKLRGVCA